MHKQPNAAKCVGFLSLNERHVPFAIHDARCTISVQAPSWEVLVYAPSNRRVLGSSERHQWQLLKSILDREKDAGLVQIYNPLLSLLFSKSGLLESWP